MSRHRLTDAARRVYPTWWRELYGEEVGQLTDDLLADGRHELRLAANLLGGALAVRVSARGMPLRRELWARRARLSIAVATLPWLAAVPFVLWSIGASSRRMTLVGRAGDTLTHSASTYVLTVSYEIVRLTILLSMLVGLMGWVALRRGMRGLPTTTRRLRVLASLPLVVVGALAGLNEARAYLRPAPGRGYVDRGSRPPGRLLMDGSAAPAHALLVTEWTLLFVGAGVSVLALWTVAKRCELWLPAITRGREISSYLAVLVGLMALCAIGGAVTSTFHGITLASIGFPSVPALPKGAPPIGMTLTVAAPRWSILAAVLGIAAVLSVAGWLSTRHATRTLWRVTTWY